MVQQEIISAESCTESYIYKNDAFNLIDRLYIGRTTAALLFSLSVVSSIEHIPREEFRRNRRKNRKSWREFISADPFSGENTEYRCASTPKHDWIPQDGAATILVPVCSRFTSFDFLVCSTTYYYPDPRIPSIAHGANFRWLSAVDRQEWSFAPGRLVGVSK